MNSGLVVYYSMYFTLFRMSLYGVHFDVCMYDGF